MSEIEKEPVSGKALWGLQIAAGAVVAVIVLSISQSLLGAAELDFGDYSEGTPRIYLAIACSYILFDLALAYGLWLAGALPRAGLAFRIASGFAVFSALVSITYQVLPRLADYDELRDFYQWFRWVYIVGFFGGMISLAAGLVLASKRTATVLVGLLCTALAVEVGYALLFQLVAEDFGRWVWEHKWAGLAISAARSIFWGTSVVLLARAVARRFDSSGEGSWARASEGLHRYRQAIVWRIFLALSVLGLSFLAAMGRSMGMIQLVMVGSILLSAIIAVHGLRGMIGFARLPMHVGGGFAATVASLLLLATVVLAGFTFVDLPAIFDKGGDVRRAVQSVQVIGNYANLLGFAAVLFVLFAIARVGNALGGEPAAFGTAGLAARAKSLAALIFIAAGAVTFIQLFAEKLTFIKSAGALVGLALVILVVALVALVKYLGLLADTVVAIETAGYPEPPRAVATIREEPGGGAV